MGKSVARAPGPRPRWRPRASADRGRCGQVGRQRAGTAVFTGVFSGGRGTSGGGGSIGGRTRSCPGVIPRVFRSHSAGPVTGRAARGGWPRGSPRLRGRCGLLRRVLALALPPVASGQRRWRGQRDSNSSPFFFYSHSPEVGSIFLEMLIWVRLPLLLIKNIFFFFEQF